VAFRKRAKGVEFAGGVLYNPPPRENTGERFLHDGAGQTQIEIKARWLRLGLTQEELAWRASLHRTYLADIECGQRNPTLRIIAQLARALDAAKTALGAGIPPGDALTEIILIEDNRTDAGLVLRALRRGRFLNPIKRCGILARRGITCSVSGRSCGGRGLACWI
jgi:transcriptional regulator with XRE-family HTH domain